MIVMNKFNLSAVITLGLFTSTMAVAQEAGTAEGTLSGNLAIATDYVARGFSQTDGDPALQGGLDWIMSAGPVTPYFGTWASTVNGKYALGVPGSHLELDIYGGLIVPLFGFDVDVGVLGYLYPGARAEGFNPNYVEYKIGATYTSLEMLSVTPTYSYSPNYFGLGYAGHNINLELTVAPPELSLGLSFHGSIARNIYSADFAQDYTDYSLGASVEIEGFSLSVTYTDTNIDEDACAKLCGKRVVGKILRNF